MNTKDCGCERCDSEDDVTCSCDGDEWDMESPAVILCGVHREAMYGRMADRYKDID